MQLLPMASSPDGLISARYAVITKTPGGGGVAMENAAPLGLSDSGSGRRRRSRSPPTTTKGNASCALQGKGNELWSN